MAYGVCDPEESLPVNATRPVPRAVSSVQSRLAWYVFAKNAVGRNETAMEQVVVGATATPVQPSLEIEKRLASAPDSDTPAR